MPKRKIITSWRKLAPTPKRDERPANGRCQLCGCLPKKGKVLLEDRAVQPQRDGTREAARGFLCVHCKSLVELVDKLGLVNLATYMVPVLNDKRTPRQDKQRKALLDRLDEERISGLD